MAAAVLLTAAGVAVLAITLGVRSLDGLAISLASTTTPMALFIGAGLVACGISTWAQPTTRVLTGVLGFGFSLVALPGANLGGFLIGTVLGVLGSSAALAWSPGERRPRQARGGRGAGEGTGSGDGRGGHRGRGGGVSEGRPAGTGAGAGDDPEDDDDNLT